MKIQKCPVHGNYLQSGKIDIRYGYPPAPPLGYFEAQEELFPYAKSWEIGGCVIVIDDSEDQTPVEFCSECRRAEKDWEAEHEMEEFWRV
jgi:hypothetical protein